MKLNVPQPLQRRQRGSGRDVDLRDDAPLHDASLDDESLEDESVDDRSGLDPVYDTAEHEVYVPPPAAPGPSGGAGHDGRSHLGSGRPRFDIRNTWQILAGSILIPVGVASIILAWYGAAHARVDQQQIPYMVSGGFLGLGAIIAGALLYWAHWLYRIYDQADLHHQQLMRSQAELRDALVGAVTGGERNQNGSASGLAAGSRYSGYSGSAGSGGSAAVAGPAGFAGSAGLEDPAGRTAFVATASGTNFHRPDCPIVARRPSGLREVSHRDTDQLQACRICDPLAGQA